jgi:ribonuclease R
MNDIDRGQIYAFFQQHPERPWHLQDIQKQLKIADRAWLRHELTSLIDEGKLVRTRKRMYGLPHEMNLMFGRLQVTAGGYGFVIPDEGESKDLFVPAEALAGAWDGDKVLARPNPSKSDDGRISGEVVRIVERKHQRLVGTLEYARGYAILRPDSPRLRERVLLMPDSVGKLEAGSRIVVNIVWPEDSGERDPFGEVQEYLGDGDDPEVETRAVIVKHDLKDTFEPETLAEADAVPPTVTGDMMAARTDMRAINTFTIDGEDAKDFDDAISLERIGGRNGHLRVGVHIADVSYYVAEGTSLDKEAKERATSVYLPGHVLPMLPETLSNGICSLVEKEPRLCLSVLVDISRDGDIKSVKFKETVIESDARLTYEQVQAYLDEEERLPRGKRKLERDLTQLAKLVSRLREARIGAGALDFNFTEAKVDVDDKGDLHVVPVKANVARQLIEELMLLANKLVAKDLSNKDIPTLYRVHEDPSDSKIQALQKSLAKLGYTIDVEQATPQDLQTIVQQAAGKPESQLVNTLLLRSLKQARYSAENLGHFGLAFENYLHFTSPIRRYPDLVVHRVLRLALQHRLSPTLKERLKSDFPALAEHTSERERRAEDAERDLTRYYHAKWAKEHRGESFTGTITGVTNFGIFISLPNAVEGLLHVSQLDDDYYMYIEDAMMLMGKHKHRKFRLGNRIDIKIGAANPTNRQIDLVTPHADLPDEPEEDVSTQSAPKRLKNPLADNKRQQASNKPEEKLVDKPADEPADEPANDKRGKSDAARDTSSKASNKSDNDSNRNRRSRSKSTRDVQAERQDAQQNNEPDRRPPPPPPRAKKKRRMLVFGEVKVKE